jgi:cell division transport system permease protein
MSKIIKTTFQHIRRSPYQAMAAILVMSLTFTIASIFIILASGSQAILNWFETRPQVTAFFKEGTKIEQVESLKVKLNETGKIASIKYVSKEEALSLYREQNKNDPLLLEMVTANILPASLEVSTTSLNYLQDAAGILKSDPQVDEVIFQEAVIDSLSSWTKALRIIGLVLLCVLAIISLTEILVIIGMKIALKKEEIEILKLIGATPWYIRAPFIFEGVIYGAIGGVIGWLISYVVLLYSTPFLVSFLADIPLLPVNPLYLVILFISMVGGGIVIGAIGSFIASKRYLS